MKTMRPAFFTALALLCLFSVEGERLKVGGLCACTALHDPVCGTDKKDYSNRGCADCAGVKVACKGKCPCKSPINGCVCTTEYAPVCGVNGKTYSNKCNADCANVAVKCPKECPCKAEECSCDPKPVCGSNGATYLNRCQAKKAGVAVACDYACPCRASVPCDNISCIYPCSRPECPAVPNARCIGTGPCGCAEVYYADCKIVDCSAQPQPSIVPTPSVRPSFCLKEGWTCDFSNGYRPKKDRCCPGLKCCEDCVKTIGKGDKHDINALHLFPFPTKKKCMRRCPKCR